MSEGMRFGRLVVTGSPVMVLYANRRRKEIPTRCDCGIEKMVHVHQLLNGSIRSCGCYRRDESSKRLKTHGMSKTNIYRRWCHLFDRCKGFKARDKKNYTDKSISVCERWKSFENFKSDMGYPPPGKTTIDRIDNSKGYSPDNCRWASPREQCNNKTNNVMITYNGVTMTNAEWARHLRVCPKALRYRIRNGWTSKDALETPYNHGNKKQS